jgi:hypothetical protein
MKRPIKQDERHRLLIGVVPWNLRSVKRELLLFDRIALPSGETAIDAMRSIGAVRQSPWPEALQFADELEALMDRGIVFDSTPLILRNLQIRKERKPGAAIGQLRV